MLYDFPIEAFRIKSKSEVIGMKVTVSEKVRQVWDKVPCIDHLDVCVRACIFADRLIKLGKAVLHTSLAVPIPAPYRRDHKDLRIGITGCKIFDHARAFLVKARAPMALIVRSVCHGDNIGIFHRLQLRKTCRKVISANAAVIKIGIQKRCQPLRISKGGMCS